MNDGVARAIGMKRMRSAGQLFLVGAPEVASKFEIASSEDAARRKSIALNEDSDEERELKATRGELGGEALQALIKNQEQMMKEIAELRMLKNSKLSVSDDEKGSKDEGSKDEDEGKPAKRKASQTAKGAPQFKKPRRGDR